MFQLADRPTHMPGLTLLGDTRGPVVDTGRDVNGWVYINEIEAAEIGRLFGMRTKADCDLLEDRVTGAEAMVAERDQRILELETELAAFDHVRSAIARANGRFGEDD